MKTGTYRKAICAVLLLAVPSCGGGDSGLATSDLAEVVEVMSELTGFDAKPELRQEVDLAVPKLVEDVVGELVDAGKEVEVEVEVEIEVQQADLPPQPGEVGYPCTVNSECHSKICIWTPDGRKCTRTCVEECPFGWKCAPASLVELEGLQICMPRHVSLCMPCRTNADCLREAHMGDVCVSFGDAGAYCGSNCQSFWDCPDGYLCALVTDVTGILATQCIPQNGVCECSQLAVELGATTDCFISNEAGKCPGSRKCVAGGLSACDAPTPKFETCNLQDDDCDGETDEDTDGGVCLVKNEFGECEGVWECKGGEVECIAATPEPEACDGKDNNCNGLTDEGYPDTDGDGLADCMESDKDNDGVVDGLDNCDAVYNPEQGDFDLDGKGDICDPDDDNDMNADEEDCAPLDPTVLKGAKEVCDGIDNNCNMLVDEGFPDTDDDEWADCLDDDDDGDGFNDDVDCMPLDATVHPTAPELCNGVDEDCDGEVDEGFPDLDADGTADCVDLDADGDGTMDSMDNCPGLFNQWQLDMDGDGLGDACDPEADGDAIPDKVDNCPGVKNVSQADLDGDGLGDACDSDVDGDGVEADVDNCLLNPNPGQEDADGDGIGDACDGDKDGDGDPDDKDCDPGDPAVSHFALEECDSKDNNCNLLIDEGFIDTDGDQVKDCVDLDDDNDEDPDDTDCATLDPAVNHNAVEKCNGIDDDCDAQIDEDQGTLECGKGECFHSVPACKDGKLASCDPLEGATQEKCDGKDNDCDGLVDEDLGVVWCGVGVCFHMTDKCVDGQEVLCDPFEGAGPEVCNGEDDDCDGEVDEDLGKTSCGVGVCYHAVPKCIDGVEVPCDPFAGASTEVCNGLDDDCDGKVDEGLGEVTCGLGECKHTVKKCQNGALVICNPFENASPEICNGKDDDCDGLVDEDLGQITCGKGVCKHLVPACVDGKEGVCDPLFGAGVEVCNGLDDDCNGEVDDGLGVMICGLGACAHEVPVCTNGVPGFCNPYEGAKEEVCNNLDDDCNGLVDDGLGKISCGLGACYQSVPACKDGKENICNPLDKASPEICDGLDNDCDGLADEGLGSTECGLGVCFHIQDNCVDGKITECDPFEGATDEVCDGLDNDCDGEVDEGFLDSDGDQTPDCVDEDDDNDTYNDDVDCMPLDPAIHPGLPEACDGIDNNCDGFKDETCAVKNCKEMLELNPGIPSGNFTLDVDGAGPAAPFTAYCLMDFDSGGWTRVAHNHHIWGTGYDSTCRNSNGVAYSEVLFKYVSGTAIGGSKYPTDHPNSTPVGFQLGCPSSNENWKGPKNWSASTCGLNVATWEATTYYEADPRDFKIEVGSTSAGIRFALIEGVAGCSTSDNSGDAYVDIYVR